MKTYTLPLDAAEEARAGFLNAEYSHIEQTDPGYYERIDCPEMAGEVYTSDFWHSPELAQRLVPIIQAHIIPICSNYRPQTMRDYHFRAYKMNAGGHFRLHIDDQGEYSFIWYLSKGWRIDWGGLLIDQGALTVPEFNKLVIRKAGASHFVTEVARCAKEPRYMLVGFW